MSQNQDKQLFSFYFLLDLWADRHDFRVSFTGKGQGINIYQVPTACQECYCGDHSVEGTQFSVTSFINSGISMSHFTSVNSFIKQSSYLTCTEG